MLLEIPANFIKFFQIDWLFLIQKSHFNTFMTQIFSIFSIIFYVWIFYYTEVKTVQSLSKMYRKQYSYRPRISNICQHWMFQTQHWNPHKIALLWNTVPTLGTKFSLPCPRQTQIASQWSPLSQWVLLCHKALLEVALTTSALKHEAISRPLNFYQSVTHYWRY